MKKCPISEAEFDCPYCLCGFCKLKHPEKECDDYYAMIGDDEDEMVTHDCLD